MTKTDELIAYISERHPMQSKYLAKVRNEMTDQDIEELGNVLDYFAEDHTIAEMGDAYLLFVEDTLAETKYFVENGSSRYRYSTLEDVIDQVYSNKAYMEKYMLGLQVSGYLWENHRKILGYFRNVLKSTGGDTHWKSARGMDNTSPSSSIKALLRIMMRSTCPRRRLT